MAAGEQRWRELADRIAGEAGFDLEDFSVVNAGRRSMVRVIVDSDDGVDLDDAAEVSRALAAAFDAEEESGGAAFATAYTLEVTSPGIGRPLTEPRHFHRARGRLIAVTTTAGQSLVVRVLGVTDTGVDVLGGKSGTEPRELLFGEIAKAKVEVDFSGPSTAVAALLAADPRTAQLNAASAEATDTTDAEAGADPASEVDPDGSKNEES